MIPNYDPATGIHYGVIGANSIDGDAFESIDRNARDLSYEAAQKEMIDKIILALEGDPSREAQLEALSHALSDLYYGERRAVDKEDAIAALIEEWTEVEHSNPPDEADREGLWQHIEDRFNDSYQCDNRSWLYEQDGYKLIDCLTNDVMILKSPFFTYAPVCSPCVPNAGNLDSIHVESCHAKSGYLKTYCLGADFFTDDVAPYPIFDVVTGLQLNEPEETPEAADV